LGLIVANMGIQSLRTMDLADVTKYVKSLVSLALLAVCLRVLWVVDMILQVKKAVRESQEDADKGDSGDVGENDTVPEQPMDDKTVVSFAIQVSNLLYFCLLVLFWSWVLGARLRVETSEIAVRSQIYFHTRLCFIFQAVIIALICMFAWGSCVSRARRLQVAVATFNNINPATAAAAAQTGKWHRPQDIIVFF